MKTIVGVGVVEGYVKVVGWGTSHLLFKLLSLISLYNN